MNALAHALPATVVVAIILFVVREILEARRRRDADKRKSAALRAIFARDCELNHWTIKSLKGAVESIRDGLKENPKTEIILFSTRTGKMMYRLKVPGERFGSGGSIYEVHISNIERYILDVAISDGNFFGLVQKGYDATKELGHVRESLIYFMAPDDEADKVHLDGFIDFALDELDDIYSSLNDLYEACTGQELKSHRLR